VNAKNKSPFGCLEDNAISLNLVKDKRKMLKQLKIYIIFLLSIFLATNSLDFSR